MHDEDNAIGLHVQNPRGESWTAYGDKRLLDKVALDSSNMCHAALQTSVDEIYAAWKIHQVPDPAAYAALSFAPTLASAQGQQELMPLFRADDYRRKDDSNRRDTDYTIDYTYPTTLADMEFSGRWKYPITMYKSIFTFRSDIHVYT